MSKIRSNASKPHRDTYEALKSAFPGATIEQEYRIDNPHTSSYVWFDFYLPYMGIAVEVQGGQHDNYNVFFHKGSKLNFVGQQKRDEFKDIWCDQNNILLIKIYESETINKELVELRFKESSGI